MSDRLVKLTKELVKEQGILPDWRKEMVGGVSQETVNKVIEFYDDDISTQCPDKKDCVNTCHWWSKNRKSKIPCSHKLK